MPGTNHESRFPRILPPPGLPVTVGEIAEFARDPYVCMHDLWRRHGEVAALQEDAQRLYFVFGPEYTRQVLSDSQRFHSQFFAIRGSRNSAQRRVTSGLLSMNGDMHKQHRRMVMEPFQKRAIVGYHESILAVAEDSLSGWRHHEIRDIGEEMTRYMLRLTSVILFGLDCSELAVRVGELTEKWVTLNHRVGPAAFFPNPELTGAYDALLSAAEELEGAVKEMIAMRRGGRLGFDVLSLLIRAHDDDANVTDDQLVGHIALLFGAAHLTSAHTLTWTLFLLSQHPEVMTLLHEELEERLGGLPPKPEDIDSLPVLDRVLKESMRILPASCYSQRVTSESVSLGPFELTRGAVVIFSQLITHHIPELFQSPQRFLPERWLNQPPAPYSYLPFGGGPRMCVGAALGTMQLKLSLMSILQRFKVSSVPGSSVNAGVMSTMLFPEGRVPMLIERQDGQFAAAPVGGNIHRLIDLPSAESERIARAA